MRLGLITLLLLAACAPKVVDPFPPFPPSGPEGGATMPLLTEPKPVTFGLEHQYDARLTPDGRFLILTAEKEQSAEITRIEIGSLRRRNLSRHSTTDEHPVLSPDGGLVAFVSRRDDATGALYTAPIETQLDFLPDFLTGYGLSRVEGPVAVVSAEWMPDDRWLLVAGNPDAPEGTRLEIVEDGQAVRTLTTNVLQPTVSPDGRWIAGIQDRRLVVVLLESGEAAPAFAHAPGVLDRDPAFHPGGRWIYFARGDEDTNGDGQVGPMDNPALFRAAFDPETGKVGGAQKLTANAHAAMMPRLTRDQIYFTSDQGGTLNIWRLPLSGRIPDGWDDMAVLEAARAARRPDEARLWLDSLIPTDDRMAQEIAFLKGESWRTAGKAAWAEREYRRTCQSEEDKSYWCGRARLARLEMRKEGGGVLSDGEIMDAVQGVLDDYPDDPEIRALGLLARGRLLMALDRDSAALRDFDSVLKDYGDYRRISASAQLEKSRLYARHFAGDPRPLLDAYRRVILDYPEQESEAESAAREVAQFALESPLNEGRRVENLRAVYQESKDLPYLPATLQMAIAAQLKQEGHNGAALDALLEVPALHGGDTRLALEAIGQLAPLVSGGMEADRAADVITAWAGKTADREAVRQALDYRDGILLDEADAQYRDGQLEAALALYSSLAQRENGRDNMGARRGMVLSLAGLGRLKELKIEGGSPADRYQRALAMSYGDPDAQDQALDEMLDLARSLPDSPYPFMAAGWLFESRATRLGLASERFKALENYLAALSMPAPPGFLPLRADLRLTLAMLLTRLGNYAKAITYFTAREADAVPYVSTAQRVSFLERWHYGLYRLGDHAGAGAKLEAAIALARDSGRTEWWNSLEEALAFLYYDQGRWGDARAVYVQLLQRLSDEDPNIPALQKNLALVNVQERRPRESLRWLGEAYRQSGTPWRLPEPGFWGNLLVGRFLVRSPINKQDYTLAPHGFDQSGTQRLLVSLLEQGSADLGMARRMGEYASLKLAMIPDEVSKTAPPYLVAERSAIRNQQALSSLADGMPEEARESWELSALEARRSTVEAQQDMVLLNRAAAIALNPGYGDSDEREAVMTALDENITRLIEMEKRSDADLVRLIRHLNARAMLNAAEAMDVRPWSEAPAEGSRGYEDVRRTLTPHLARLRLAKVDLDMAISLAENLPDALIGDWPSRLRANRAGLEASPVAESVAEENLDAGPSLPEGEVDGLLWREEDAGRYEDRLRPGLVRLIEERRWTELAEAMEAGEASLAASGYRRAWRAGLSEWMESEEIRQWEQVRADCPPLPMQCAALREAAVSFKAKAPAWLVQRWLGSPARVTDIQWILEPGDLALRVAWVPPYLVAIAVDAHTVEGTALRLDRFLADGMAGPIRTGDYQTLLIALSNRIDRSRRLFLALDETAWGEVWTSLPWSDSVLSEKVSLAYGPDLTTLLRSYESRRVGLRIKAHLTRRISPTLQLGQAVYSPLTAVLPDVVSSLLPNPFEWIGMLGEYLSTPDLISLQGLDAPMASQIMERSNLLWLESLQPVPSNPFLTGLWVGKDDDPLGWLMPAATGPRGFGATLVVLEADWETLPGRTARADWVRSMSRMALGGGASSVLMSTYDAPCAPEGIASANGVIFEAVLRQLPEMSAARAVWSVTRNQRPSELITCDAAPHVRLIGHWGQEPEQARQFASENLPRVRDLALDLYRKGRFQEAGAEFRRGLSYLDVLGQDEGRDKFLQALVASYFKDGRLELAIEAQQRLVDLLATPDAQAGLPDALLKLGNLLQQKGDAAAALASYLAALGQAEAQGDRTQMARARLAIATLQENDGKYEEALEALASARKDLEDSEPKLGAAIERARGRVLFQRLSRHDEALPAYNDAMSLARKAGDKSLEAATMSDIGLVFERQFRFTEAIAAQQQAIQMLAGLEDSAELRRLRLQGRIYEANAHFQGGDLQRAATMAGEARTEAQSLGDKELEKFATNLSGLAALHLGDFEKALNDQQANLALALQSGRDMDVAAAWNNLGRVWRDQGDYMRARNAYEEARTLDARLGDASGLSYDHRHLGHLSLLEGKWEEARTNLTQALSFASTSGQRTNELEALTDLIWLDWREGRPSAATGRLERAVELASRSVDPDHWRTEFRLARLTGMLATGEARTAIWRPAADLLENFWIWDPSAWAFMQIRHPDGAPPMLDDWRGLYDDLVADALARGQLPEAEEWMERWRRLRPRAWYARSFQPQVKPVPDSEDHLWEEARRLVRQRTAIRNLPALEATRAISSWEQERGRWEEGRRRLARQDALAAARLGQTGGLEMPTGRWLAFWTTETALIRIEHHEGKAEVKMIPASRASLVHRGRDLARRLESWAPVQDELARFGADLLDGISVGAQADGITLVVDEYLAGLPWAALVLADGRRLGEVGELRTVPWHLQPSPGGRDEPEGSWLTIAGVGGVENHPDPPMGAVEASEIKRIHRDTQTLSGGPIAWAGILQSALQSPLRRIHMAVHEEAGPSPRLRLSPGQFVTLEDIFSRPAPAPSIALSACRSGTGRLWPEVSPAEALLFMGAREVEATAWRIGDVETALVFKHYYRNRMRGNDGPAALRAAQASVATYHPHPSAWAGVLWMGQAGE